MSESHPTKEPAAAELEARSMSSSRIVMAEIVMPNDANPHGTLSGGRLMHWIDIAGAMAAMRHCRGKVVTVAFDEVVFHAPVPVGFMVHLEALVTCTGRTSMEVKVVAQGEDPTSGDSFETTTAHVVFVAIDDEGRPRQAPPVEAETAEERALMDRGRARRRRRLEHRRQGATDPT